jgi:hypothetical protein
MALNSNLYLNSFGCSLLKMQNLSLLSFFSLLAQRNIQAQP